MIHKIFSQKNVLLLFIFFAFVYFALAILGGINYYSPVPYFDAWDGYLVFYGMISDDNFKAWWMQHNEHRIVLSRILFWLDLTLFKGQMKFLIICNYLLVVLIFYTIYKALAETLPQKQDEFTKYAIASIIFCWLFSFIQAMNLVLGFQSQFFLAQLIPLVAFFLLHKTYVSQTHSLEFFVLSCLAGVLAIGTMANGILTLPLMLILAMVLRMRAWQVMTLLILAISTLCFYFYGYSSPTTHIFSENTFTILKFLAYTFLYMGNIFYPIFGFVGSLLAGIFLFVSVMGFILKFIKTPMTSSLELALVTFILFIWGTALATASGRLGFGLSQALEGRYTTPTLVAWSILLVLFAPMIAQQVRISWHRILPLLLIPILWFAGQYDAFESEKIRILKYEVQITALALELGINDEQQLTLVYPNPDRILTIAKVAAQRNISVFNHPLIKDAALLLGHKQEKQAATQCEGKLNTPLLIKSDPRYMQVSGVLLNPKNKTAPSIIYILNNERIIVGYALSGPIGFKGYLYSDLKGQSVVLQDSQLECELQVDLLPPILK